MRWYNTPSQHTRESKVSGPFEDSCSTSSLTASSGTSASGSESLFLSRLGCCGFSIVVRGVREADQVPGRAYADSRGTANACLFCRGSMSTFDSVCQMEVTEDAACSFLTTVALVYVFRDCDVVPTTARPVCLQSPSTRRDLLHSGRSGSASHPPLMFCVHLWNSDHTRA